MDPRVFRVNGSISDPAAVTEAAAVIRRGGLVAFPTETVYGLAADWTNPRAIARLNYVKGRPAGKPYSLHLSDAIQVQELIGAVPTLAERLIERFWPGPLTIVISASDGRTLGFRLPAHPLAQAFLSACSDPIAAPSANRSGWPAPTTADEVLATLDGEFDLLLDGGPTPGGRESSVVEVINERLNILREGATSIATILEFASQGAGGSPPRQS